VDIGEFQRLMAATYGERDRARGLDASFGWFVEEVGELSRALRRGDDEDRLREFGDVLAWLASIAEQAAIDLTAAADRYRDGCPTCGQRPCTC